MLSKNDYDILNSCRFNLLHCLESIRKYVTIYKLDKKDISNMLPQCERCFIQLYNQFICVYYIRRGEYPLEFYKNALQLYVYLLENYTLPVHIANRILNNVQSKRVRLKKFIKKMLDSGECLFLTCTFTDNLLKRTSYVTRRRYIQRFLKSYNTNAVANIDFGEKKHREHYHAILQNDFINANDYKYGNLDIARINYTGVACTKLTRYITKLTYHALKKSTKNNTNLLYIHKKELKKCTI